VLTASDARELIDHQVAVIERDWAEVCDLAQMSAVDRAFFWGRQFLNRYAFEGYSGAPV
jgi:serine/threonine-protein kinase HipA